MSTAKELYHTSNGEHSIVTLGRTVCDLINRSDHDANERSGESDKLNLNGSSV